MLHELAAQAVTFAASKGWNNYTIVSPGLLLQNELELLQKTEAVQKIFAPGLDEEGKTHDYIAGTPMKVTGPVLLLASDTLLTRWTVVAALKAKQWGVYCVDNGQFRFVPFYSFAAWWFGDILIDRVNSRGGKDRFYRIATWIYNRPVLRNIVKAILRRPLTVTTSQVAENREHEIKLRDQLAAIFTETLAVAPKNNHVPGRVILINGGLGAGGAERQVVNSLLGLHARGVDVSFLGEYLFKHESLDFFQPMLVSAGVPSRQVNRKFRLTHGDLASVSPALVNMHLLLPSNVIEEIANLVLEFREARPEVVHAWQDATSIKVAIAALIVGVPRILVSSRNMSPPNFAYHTDYMRPAYQALAALKEIVFINNSEAGAVDYCQWLSVPRERFTVVRNGVNFNKLRRCGADEQQAFRAQYNLPATAPLIGSMFRFWAEKRPMLWLESAVLLAADLPEHHFILAGDGPMREEMLAYLRSVPATTRNRIHLIEPQKDISPFHSSLEVFFMASAFEGTPNVALEAQWCGAPVVSTNAGGTAEAVFIGQTGLIVEGSSAAELAAAVRTVQSDPLYKSRTLELAQTLITQRYGFDRMIDETMVVYGWSERVTPAAARSA